MRDAAARARSRQAVESGGGEFFDRVEAMFAFWDMQVRERDVSGAVATAQLLARDFPEYNQISSPTIDCCRAVGVRAGCTPCEELVCTTTATAALPRMLRARLQRPPPSRVRRT